MGFSNFSKVCMNDIVFLNKVGKHKIEKISSEEVRLFTYINILTYKLCNALSYEIIMYIFLLFESAPLFAFCTTEFSKVYHLRLHWELRVLWFQSDLQTRREKPFCAPPFCNDFFYVCQGLEHNLLTCRCIFSFMQAKR